VWAGDFVASAELVALLSSHASLCELELDRVRLDGEAAVAALAACANVTGVSMLGGSPDLVPMGVTGTLELPLLALLLRRAGAPPLRALRMTCGGMHDATAAAAVADVLRSAPLLELSLQCTGARLGSVCRGFNSRELEVLATPAVAEALAHGLAGHPSLQRLWLRDLLRPAPPDSRSRAAPVAQPCCSRLLAALLADAPALTALHVSGGACAFANAGKHDIDQTTFDSDACDEALRTLLAALAALAAAQGAPRLRHLSVPAHGLLRSLRGADVRHAAPALHSLTLLYCVDFDHDDNNNLARDCHGRGAARRWVPKLDVMDDEAVAAAEEEEAEAAAAEAAEAAEAEATWQRLYVHEASLWREE
jgi:hypothetical protein